MSNFVNIHLGFEDNKESIESITDFFSPFAIVQITKAEQKATKSWDKVIEIAIIVVGPWAIEKFILNPLSDKANEWLNAIKDFWRKSGCQHKVNVIVKLQQDNFEIHFSSTHDPEILKQVWKATKDIIELLEKYDVKVDKIRITTNSDKSFLVIGYSGSQPKYTFNLGANTISPIKSFSNTSKDEFDPEVEIWAITLLGRRLEYLKFIQQQGYAVSPSDITNLEKEILDRKKKLSI